MMVLWGSVASWADAFMTTASPSTPNRYHARLLFIGYLPCCSGKGAALPHPACECPRSESNRHAFKGGGFSYHLGFRRPGQESRVRGLEHAFTVAVPALGARRLLSTPSPRRAQGLARR